MRTGVTLGGRHSWRDFKLLLTSRVIGLPEPQMSKITVPGRDGDLDLTEALDGNVHYGNRTIELTFSTVCRLTGRAWGELLADFAFHVHGRQLQIIFDDDPGYYYLGRCSVSGFDVRTSTTEQTLTVVCDCQPYRIATEETVVTVNVNPAYRTVSIRNGRMPSIPTITFSAPCRLKAYGEEYDFDAGTYRSKDMVLAPGINTVYIKTLEDIATAEVRFTRGDL